VYTPFWRRTGSQWLTCRRQEDVPSQVCLEPAAAQFIWTAHKAKSEAKIEAEARFFLQRLTQFFSVLCFRLRLVFVITLIWTLRTSWGISVTSCRLESLLLRLEEKFYIFQSKMEKDGSKAPGRQNLYKNKGKDTEVRSFDIIFV